MPRRSNAARAPDLDVDIDDDGVDSTMTADSSVVSGGPPPSQEVLRARAREFLDLNQQIKELGAQVAVLRKSLKSVEKSLYNGMQLTNLEELELDGLKILRTKKLQISDE
jgi:hypothetical protein